MGGLIEVGGIEVNAIDGAAVRPVRPGQSHSSPHHRQHRTRRWQRPDDSHKRDLKPLFGYGTEPDSAFPEGKTVPTASRVSSSIRSIL